jgi:hypothetical protein
VGPALHALPLSSLSLPRAGSVLSQVGSVIYRRLATHAMYSGRGSSFFLAYDSQEAGAAFLAALSGIPDGVPDPVQPVLYQKLIIVTKTYLRKMKASPATRRLALTKTLQPLCKRCLRG